MTVLPPLSLLAPLVLLAVALLAITRPHRRPKALPALAEGAALATLGLAMAAVVQL